MPKNTRFLLFWLSLLLKLVILVLPSKSPRVREPQKSMRLYPGEVVLRAFGFHKPVWAPVVPSFRFGGTGVGGRRVQIPYLRRYDWSPENDFARVARQKNLY